MSVLPFLTPYEPPAAGPLPLFREWACDVNGHLLVTDGRTQLLSGADALRVWVHKALRTARGRFAAYGIDYGTSLEDLVGQPYSEAFVQAEAQRMVGEALLASPYITGVGDVTVRMDDGILQISASYTSIYGTDNAEVTA